VAATVIVVQSSRSTSDGSSSPPAATGTNGAKGGSKTSTTGRHRHTPSTYTVKSGDILSTVSRRTGVSVDRIQQLNPGIDPQALQVGQKLRLRSSGGHSGGSGAP
jgi:LysM repeat protein